MRLDQESLKVILGSLSSSARVYKQKCSKLILKSVMVLDGDKWGHVTRSDLRACSTSIFGELCEAAGLANKLVCERKTKLANGCAIRGPAVAFPIPSPQKTSTQLGSYILALSNILSFMSKRLKLDIILKLITDLLFSELEPEQELEYSFNLIQPHPPPLQARPNINPTASPNPS